MDLQAALIEKLGDELFEKRLAQTVKSFEGLINKKAAILILAKEEGLVSEEEKFIRIVEIEKNAKSVTLKAKVGKIWPIATYASGKKSRVYEIEDESGKIPLIVWNKDIEKFSGLRLNDQIKVENAYESGSELHLGYNGTVILVKRAEFEQLDLIVQRYETEQKPFLVNIRGSLAEKCSSEGIFKISNGNKELECLLEEGIERKEAINQSIEVIIEKGIFDGKKIIIDKETRILCRKKPPETWLILDINEDESGAILLTDRGRIRLDRKELLKVLDLNIAQDIKTSTVITLKKDSIINSKITLNKEDSGG